MHATDRVSLVHHSSTPAEVEERRLAAGQDPKLGYDNADRDTSDAARAAFRAEGREPVLRLRMPDTDLVFDDLVRAKPPLPREPVSLTPATVAALRVWGR